MSWTQQVTPMGVYFQQNLEQNLDKVAVSSILCGSHFQNNMQINFANNAYADSFLKLLESLSGLKTRRTSATIEMTFSNNVKILNQIVNTLSQIEILPQTLTDAIYNAFNLNDHQRLQEMRDALQHRVKLLNQLLTTIETAELDNTGNKNELASEILDLLPKESIGKLRGENCELEKMLHSSPTERKKAKEQSATKLVRFKTPSPETITQTATPRSQCNVSPVSVTQVGFTPAAILAGCVSTTNPMTCNTKANENNTAESIRFSN